MKAFWKSLSCLLLAAVLLTASLPASAAGPVMGDINGDGSINAADALLALQYSVVLRTFNAAEKTAAEVSGDSRINASDALLILQKSVQMIAEFPNKGIGKVNMDLYYNVDGHDFVTPQVIEDINNSEEVINKLGGVHEPTAVEMFELDECSRLIYNPISREAAKRGELNKYRSAPQTTGSIEVGDYTVNYSLPTSMTAYDAVPISYTVNGTGFDSVHIEAVAFEEADRTGGNDWYDLNLPGTVDVDLTYEGYVTAKWNRAYKPNLSGRKDDKLGTQYPSFDAAELTRSGTLRTGDLTWLKFHYKNTGDTILDGDGNGTFCFQPLLYKLDSNGAVTGETVNTENLYERIFDYFYPGEEGDMWVNFVNRTYAVGNYRVVINSLVRNERKGGPNVGATIWGGYVASSSSFEFTVTPEGAITEPKPVVKDMVYSPSHNDWLRTYEEFMSSYETIAVVPETISSTMYVQPAPWTEEIVLKVMTGDNRDMKAVRIPVKVETDSIRLNLNPDNNNYQILPDGSRTPLIAAQSMADMRSNVARGPDCATTIINDLTDMKNVGINYISSTIAFGYDTKTDPANYALDANKFMMDVARSMGCFLLEGYISYPYTSGLDFGRSVGADDIGKGTTSYSDPLLDRANAYASNYTYLRYGDWFWQAHDGTRQLTTEDTRGWLRVDIYRRYGLGAGTLKNFGEWLKSKYKTIDELNAAYGYGAAYEDFDQLRIGREASNDYSKGAYDFKNTGMPFHDWTVAMADLDLYRSVERANNYINLIRDLETATVPRAPEVSVPDAKITLRTEGANWLVAGIDPDTTNYHYRHAYYSQRRCGMIAEVLQASGVMFGHSDYTTLPYSPSEVYELTKKAAEQGIVEVPLAQFNRMREVVINPLYGSSQYLMEYNLADDGMTKGAYFSTLTAIYPWFEAVYAGGGIPGLLWQDYLCDGYATSTQYKELKFYKQKVDEMLATPEGHEWATVFDAPDQTWREGVGLWAYPQEYIEQKIADNVYTCVFDHQ